MDIALPDAMRQVRDRCGLAALRDARRLRAGLADVLLGERRGEREIILRILAEGLPDRMVGDSWTEEALRFRAGHLAETWCFRDDPVLDALRCWRDVLADVTPEAWEACLVPGSPAEEESGADEASDSGGWAQDGASGPGRNDDGAGSSGGPSRAAESPADAAPADGHPLSAGRMGPRRALPAAAAIILILAAILAALAGPAWLSGPADGPESRKASRFEIYLEAARAGDAAAQHFLARLYLHGRGVARDDAQAAQWCLKAAENGNLEAAHDIGLLYARGRGVPRNDILARTWQSRAAEGGHAGARYELCVMWEHGYGGPRDAARAFGFCRQAAEAGHAYAQLDLGRMYEEGIGVERSSAQALRWYEQAAGRKLVEAENRLKRLRAAPEPGARRTGRPGMP